MPKQVVNNERPASQQRSIAMSAAAALPPIGATMKEKLPSALLSNTERNELHQQIYTYFAWLNENMVTADNSGQKAKANDIGFITGIKNILTSMEEGLGDYIPTLKKVAEDHLKSRKPPYFEHGYISELKKRVDNNNPVSRKKRKTTEGQMKSKTQSVQPTNGKAELSHLPMFTLQVPPGRLYLAIKLEGDKSGAVITDVHDVSFYYVQGWSVYITFSHY
jgi:hypothetical protein